MWSHKKHKINFQRFIFVKFPEKDTHKWHLTNEVSTSSLNIEKETFKKLLNEIFCKSWLPVANPGLGISLFLIMGLNAHTL